MYLEQLHETYKCQDGSSPMETAALAKRTQGPNFAPLDKGSGRVCRRRQMPEPCSHPTCGAPRASL